VSEDLLRMVEKIYEGKSNAEVKKHKFALILAISKLYSEDSERENKFHITPKLEEYFREMMFELAPDVNFLPSMIEAPFYFLQNNGFWNLCLRAGKEAELRDIIENKNSRFTKNRLLDIFNYAYFPDEVHQFLQNPITRQKLMTSILNRFSEKSSSVNQGSLQRLKTESDEYDFTNPFVSYLNSLQRSGGSNENALAESQACNPLFASIHVVHPLADIIFDELRAPDGKHIILTGHAGDGKSTLALEVFKRFTGTTSDSPLERPMATREDVSGVSIFKDLSERNKAEDQNFLNELIDKQRRFLMVTNTGTLLDLIKNHPDQFDGGEVSLESKVLDAISTESGEGTLVLGPVEFRVFNLARMDNLSLARQIFEKMIAPERWEFCLGKSCRDGCPICLNVDLIQQNQQRIVGRIFLAYRRMYEYGTRLTMRQFTEHLAYMITSGLEYADIQQMHQKEQKSLIVEHLFFNRFFGDNGHSVDSDAIQMKAIQEVAHQSFGERPCPMWEHRLWLRSSGKTFELGVESCNAEFNKLRQHGARESSYLGMSPGQAREQVRRMLYFLYDFNIQEQSYLGQYLNSPTLLNWQSWQQPNVQLGFHEKTMLDQKIYHVLQEHLTGVRLPEGSTQHDRRLYVTLSRRRNEVRQSAQVVLAQVDWVTGVELKLTGFKSVSGGTRYDLVLYGKERIEGIDLMLRVPFLDYVMMRHFGELGEVLQASYLERLDRFKAQVQKRAAGADGDRIMLVRLKTDHTFRRQHYAVNNSRLEVTDVL